MRYIENHNTMKPSFKMNILILFLLIKVPNQH
jgi:hypothetical protein